MKKLIIFDMDGTLLDSGESLANSLNFTLNKLGLKTYEVSLIKTWVGNGASVLIKRGLVGKKEFSENEINQDLFKKAKDIFLTHYGQTLTNGVRLFDGVKETLEYFYNKGIFLAVATNKPIQFTIPLLKYFNIDTFFSKIVADDGKILKKPNPDMILNILNELNINKNEAIMVGDSYNDLNSAKSAKIDFIGVSFGYTDVKLEGIIVDDFRELKRIIKC